MYNNRLERDFFARDTQVVAKELLGKLLVRRWRSTYLTGRITEVESYVGEDDEACHARFGKTKRNAVMFGEAGRAYVYLIYGMYHCLNIVTERDGFPAAVLIRGARPILNVTQSIDGPGKLCRELHIARTQNQEDLTASTKLYIADDDWSVDPGDIQSLPRIGIDYAGEDAKLPWRYVLNDSILALQR